MERDNIIRVGRKFDSEVSSDNGPEVMIVTYVDDTTVHFRHPGRHGRMIMDIEKFCSLAKIRKEK